MRFVITGGGTAGHINPALATAHELRALGHEVFYAGKPESMESELVPKEGFTFEPFKAAGFNRKKPWTAITSSAKMNNSARKAQKWLSKIQPDAVIGFGGYVSIPVGLAAARQKIPLIIHEQNATPGLANKLLSKNATVVALSYESSRSSFNTKAKLVLVGNPVRASLLGIDKAAARKFFDIPKDAKLLFAFGGSLGAQHLNEALVEQHKAILAIPNLYVLHVTGARDFDAVSDAISKGLYEIDLDDQDIERSEVNSKDAMVSAGGKYEAEPSEESMTELQLLAEHTDEDLSVPDEAAGDEQADKGRWKILEYCNNMGEAYAAADLVLSRAGATTLAELVALEKPAILVPYPHAAADEQTKNAATIVESGAALMVADKDLEESIFANTLLGCLEDDARVAEMAKNAKASKAVDARQEFARLIVELAAAN